MYGNEPPNEDINLINLNILKLVSSSLRSHYAGTAHRFNSVSTFSKTKIKKKNNADGKEMKKKEATDSSRLFAG